MRCKSLIIGLGLFALASHSLADSVVLGTSNPYLAGMPDGTTARDGDSAPDQSPVFAFSVTPGQHIRFTAIGEVSNGAGGSTDGPDGGVFQTHSVGVDFTGNENGISDINAPLNSLLGVFLNDNAPNPVAPGALDFSSGGTDYTSLSPELQQLFFIGDGLTSAFVQQEVIVPAGATRLFLGTMDGFDWNNNSGAFVVSAVVTDGVSTPLPSPAIAGLALLGGMGLMPIIRRRYPAKA